MVQHTCPGCGETSEVSGAVDRDTLKTQIGAKDQEIRSLKTALQEAQTAAGDVTAIRKERDDLRTELDQVREAATISAAYQAAGVPEADGVREGFRALHASAMAGRSEEERVSLAEWIGSEEAKAHPLLSSHYSATDNQTPEGRLAGDQTPEGRLAGDQTKGRPPNLDQGTGNPPDRAGVKTAQEVAEYFGSPEFQALSPTKQRERRMELQAQVGLEGRFQPRRRFGVQDPE